MRRKCRQGIAKQGQVCDRLRMFKPTDRQLRLDGPAATLAERSRARLRASWAEPFRSKVMPLLLESEAEFASAYHATTGRPNWSVARLLGILVMQEFRGLGDQEALDELAFDARWQYALDLPADDAYLSRRSLVDFRSRLVDLDPEMAKLRRVFLAVTAAAMAELKVSFAEQRLDSTHVISNIRTRGRVDLFGKTLRHFLRELKRQWPQHWERVSAALRTFDSATCRACPLGQRCVVRGPDNGTSGSFNLELAPRQRVRDERLAEQDTPAFRERYAIRAGIEATNSELKRVHRIDRLRVRRLPRVRMAVALKVTACNVKRWLRAAATAAAAALLGALQALWVLFCATRRSAAWLPAR